MTTETELSNDLPVDAPTPAPVDDTTMDGEFSAAEREGLEAFAKLAEAQANGEDFDFEEDADEPKPEDVPKADTVEAKKDEPAAELPKSADPATDGPSAEQVSAEILSLTEQAKSAEQELQAVEEKVIALGDKLENGEINQARYEIEHRRLMRELEAKEKALDASHAAVAESEGMLAQVEQSNDPWFKASVAFFGDSSNAVFQHGEHHLGLIEFVKTAAALPVNADKTPDIIIANAAKSYRLMAGLESAPAKQEPAKPAAKKEDPKNIPPTLGMMQQALPDNDDGPYAHLSKLSGEALEAAFLKMTSDQVDAYLGSLK